VRLGYALQVNVVNAHHTKTLPGRKTDVLDCQWLQKLHTFGLLNNSFQLAEEIWVLRTYMRQREKLVLGLRSQPETTSKAQQHPRERIDAFINCGRGATGHFIVWTARAYNHHNPTGQRVLILNPIRRKSRMVSRRRASPAGRIIR
jgi:hypothetical protein